MINSIARFWRKLWEFPPAWKEAELAESLSPLVRADITVDSSASDRCDQAFKQLGSALEEWEKRLVARNKFVKSTGSGVVHVGIGLEQQ